MPLLALQPMALATLRPAAATRNRPSLAPAAPVTAPVAFAEPVQRTPFPPPSARQTSRLELATPSPPAGPPAPAWVDPASAAVASGLATRAPDGSVVFTTPSDEPTVQRQAEAAGPPPPAPSTGAAPAGGAQTNDQVDELAKRVYDTIRQRLKAELRLDRERSGRLTDLSR